MKQWFVIPAVISKATDWYFFASVAIDAQQGIFTSVLVLPLEWYPNVMKNTNTHKTDMALWDQTEPQRECDWAFRSRRGCPLHTELSFHTASLGSPLHFTPYYCLSVRQRHLNSHRSEHIWDLHPFNGTYLIVATSPASVHCGHWRSWWIHKPFLFLVEYLGFSSYVRYCMSEEH